MLLKTGFQGSPVLALLGVLISQQGFGLVHDFKHHSQCLCIKSNARKQVEHEGPRPGEALPERQGWDTIRCHFGQLHHWANKAVCDK